MPQRYQNRTLAAYAMHGRAVDEVVDYPQFFEWLSTLTAASRIVDTPDGIIAIASIREEDGRFVLRLVTGTRGETPLFFDVVSGAERDADLDDEREIVANATSAVVHPRSRFFVIERRRPGVAVDLVEVLLTRLGRRQFGSSFSFSLTPVVTEEFVAELDQFERIRRTEIELTRPNFDWGDNAARLAELAGESNAETMSVAATASRGGALAKDSGIVADAKELAEHRIGPVKNIRVIGRRVGESVERIVSFTAHIVRRVIPLPTSATPGEKRAIVEGAAADFVESLASTATSAAGTGDSVQA